MVSAMETKRPYILGVLEQYYQAKRRVNPSYSKRAFAQLLNVSPSYLSELLKNKKTLSKAMARKMANKLKMTGIELDLFQTYSDLSYEKDPEKIKRLEDKIDRLKQQKSVDLEYFETLSDSNIFVLLEMIQLKDFKPDLKWLAARLNLTEIKTDLLVRRMIQLGILEVTEKGDWIDKIGSFDYRGGIPSLIVQKYQKKIIEKAHCSLSEQSIEKRDCASNIMSFSSDKIDQVRDILRETRKKVASLSMASESKDAVYCLSTQFFSMTNLEEE
jgi:uncharacterized protein (TIGR02147 family)